jgi:hypothetical protein
MQSLPAPSIDEVEDYKVFLARSMAICEPETRFLQMDNDLVSLAGREWEDPEKLEPPRDFDRDHGPPKLIMPGVPASPVQLSPRPDHAHAARARNSAVKVQSRRKKSPFHLVYAAFLAVAIPMVTFTVVHGLGERMVVVLLVFSGIATAVYQSGLVADQGVAECIGCAGLYVVLMAGLAQVFVD